MQSYRQYDTDGSFATLQARENSGLNHQGVCYGADVAAFMGGQGAKWRQDDTYTLDATDRHAVCIDCRNMKGDEEISGTLQAKPNGGQSLNYQNPVCVQNTGRGWWNESDIGATLRTPSGGGGENLVVYDARGNGDGDTVPNLTGDHENRVTDYTAVCVENSGHKHDVADTIDASYWKGPGARNGNEREVVVVGADGAGTLCAESYPGKLAHQDVCQGLYPVQLSDKPPRRYIVRRLTPLECCRLQGFPDWWEDGADGSDSARHKMWGNGIALPCAADVLGRIAKEMMKDDQI